MNNSPNLSGINDKRIKELEERVEHLEKILGQENVVNIMRQRRKMNTKQLKRRLWLDEIRAYQEKDRRDNNGICN